MSPIIFLNISFDYSLFDFFFIFKGLMSLYFYMYFLIYEVVHIKYRYKKLMKNNYCYSCLYAAAPIKPGWSATISFVVTLLL